MSILQSMTELKRELDEIDAILPRCEKESSGMELHDVVMKLVGPIRAVGETNEDGRRLENLKVLTGLVDHLLFEISKAAIAVNRPEASMKKVGAHASAYLQGIQRA